MKCLSILGVSSTKSSIVELLSEKWPLTARKIYFRLTKNYSIPITYQAVHKALKELTEEKILIKNNQGYTISKEWVKNLADFGEKLTSELNSSNQKREIKTIQKLTFDTHTDFIKFHIAFMEDLIKKDKKIDMVFHYRQVPYPHVLSHEQINKMKKLMPKIKWTMLIKKDTQVGRWCAKQWKKMGVDVKIGADISEDRMIFLNDYLFRVYTSKESTRLWDKAYSIKDIKNFDINSTIENISNSKHKTIITITKDKEMVSLLK